MIDTTNMSFMANLIQPTSSTISTNMISKKDSDSDSSLSIEEMGVSSELFSSYDLDSDSLVSQSELASAIDTAMNKFNGNMPTKEEFQSVLSDFGFEVPSNPNSNNLTSSQSDTIASVLENYDANNLSKSDALEIVAAFKEAGIQPSAELASAMSEAGFDAHEVGTLAGLLEAKVVDHLVEAVLLVAVVKAVEAHLKKNMMLWIQMKMVLYHLLKWKHIMVLMMIQVQTYL